jgi:hypothetical protein
MAYLSETPAFFEGSVGENLLLHASADLREHGAQLWCEFWKTEAWQTTAVASPDGRLSVRG